MARTPFNPKRKTDKNYDSRKASPSDDESSKNSPSKTDIEMINSYSDESVRQDPSDTKMAAKLSKTKPTKKKSLPKDPVTLDSDRVDVIETVPPSFPDKPAKMNKKQYMKYYKKKAHYYQKRHEGAKTTLGDFSDVSYSSSEGDKGMTCTYGVKDLSSGSRLKKTNIDNRGKIAYHKIKDKTLLDYVKNKANEGCRDLPLASPCTLYPGLTFVDDEGMQ